LLLVYLLRHIDLVHPIIISAIMSYPQLQIALRVWTLSKLFELLDLLEELVVLLLLSQLVILHRLSVVRTVAEVWLRL